MHPDTIPDAVRVLLERTGIGRQLAAEAEQTRAKEHAELRARKADSVRKLLAARPKAEDAVRAAEAKQKAAAAAAEAALVEYVRARERLDQVVGEHSGELEQIEPAMRRCYDPKIDAFRQELLELKDDCPRLYRTTPDAKGPLQDQAGRRFRDNRDAIERRVRTILDVIDAADRLKVAHDVDDVEAEIARLRKSIPEA